MREEALKLANELDDQFEYYRGIPRKETSAMIRRLVEELDKANNDLKKYDELAFDDLDKQNQSVFTILTCGCKSEFMGFPSEWDGETRECEPCVNYGSLCEKHFMEYEARPAQYTPQQWYMVNKDGYVKPLSDKEIDEILDHLIDEDEDCSYHDFARLIEERHGIK